MPRFSDRETNLRCGGCGKGATVAPFGQELEHSDGTQLCPGVELDAEVVPGETGEQRRDRASARFLLGVEAYEDRSRRPRGIAVLVGMLGFALFVGCAVVWTIAELLR